MTDLIFMDTETTGLNPEIHEVWEIATAKNDEKVDSFFLTHTLRGADPKALEMNGYHERFVYYDVLTVAEELKLRESFRDQTIVVANPTFDRMMLRERWRLEPWHYRSIDIESMALGILQYDRPQGMKRITEDLANRGYPMPIPNHTAGADVAALREAYKALRMIQRSFVASAP